MRYVLLIFIAALSYSCSCVNEETETKNVNTSEETVLENETVKEESSSEPSNPDTIIKEEKRLKEDKKTVVIRKLTGNFRDVRKRDDYYVVDVYSQNRLFTFAFKEEKTYNLLKKEKKHNDPIALKWQGRQGVTIDGEPDLSGLLVSLED